MSLSRTDRIYRSGYAFLLRVGRPTLSSICASAILRSGNACGEEENNRRKTGRSSDPRAHDDSFILLLPVDQCPQFSVSKFCRVLTKAVPRYRASPNKIPNMKLNPPVPRLQLSCFRGVSRSLGLFVALCSSAHAVSPSSWAKHVPGADRSRPNPVANQPDAVSAGEKLYSQQCARCHGQNAEGKGHHPSLRSERVHADTPGELEWFIAHGARFRMPSFAKKLSDKERWEIVSYIQSLSVTKK
jgi:mono/diheme cytochrome c family protein